MLRVLPSRTNYMFASINILLLSVDFEKVVKFSYFYNGCLNMKSIKLSVILVCSLYESDDAQISIVKFSESINEKLGVIIRLSL